MGSSDTAVPSEPGTETAVETKTKKSTRPKPKPGHPSMWHVVLHDDPDHTYGYVMGMLWRLFGKSRQDSFRMACEVDRTGRVICETTHTERAEFKRDQILGYGPDPLLARSTRSMFATIETADWGGGDDNDADSNGRGEDRSRPEPGRSSGS
ncbi:MAG: ATP-dependent Clp protease adaptor ClpS [Planctomycetota bacterium]